MTDCPKQVILGVLFPGVNENLAWSNQAWGSHMEFASFAHVARMAEIGKFDFFFLTEDLQLPEQDGKIHDLDIIGRPDNLTILTALAAVTTHLGLAGTVQTTYNEPYEIAHQFATLDHLSEGRAAWNIVTSPNPSIGANFRRGGYLDYSERYLRAAEFIWVARKLWDSWAQDAIAADKAGGNFLQNAASGAFVHDGSQFCIEGHFTVPRSPQRYPVIIQAGDSDAGREFAVADADMIFTRHGSFQAGREFCADLRSRLAHHGRAPNDLKVLPSSQFVLGDTKAEAHDRAYAVRRQQVTSQWAIRLLEQVWNCDLSSYDADGPLPATDPVVPEISNTGKSTVKSFNRLAIAERWRAMADERKLSIRDLIIEVTNAHSFVGTPTAIAEEISNYVQNDACDGFILVPTAIPRGLDEFVDRVVPILQERKVLRAEYQAGSTLRDNLGLPPVTGAARPPGLGPSTVD